MNLRSLHPGLLWSRFEAWLFEPLDVDVPVLPHRDADPNGLRRTGREEPWWAFDAAAGVIDVRFEGPRCHRASRTPGYAPCSRLQGHEGPCAHMTRLAGEGVKGNDRVDIRDKYAFGWNAGARRYSSGRCGKSGCNRPAGHDGNHSIEGADRKEDE